MKPVVASTAYLLISHGSRDPRPQVAMDRLADLVRKHLEAVPQQAAAGNERLRSQHFNPAERTFSNSASPHSAAERTALLTKPG